jgi:hypothetical protein
VSTEKTNIIKRGTYSPNPELEVTLEKPKDYAYVRIINPSSTLDEARFTWGSIANACKESCINKVLITQTADVRELTTMEMFTFATELHDLGFTGFYIAFHDEEVAKHPNNLFGETVAVNRGIIGKVFLNLEEAEEWIYNID